MMSKEFLKRIGVIGIAIGLTASPFAMAHAVDHEEAPGQEVEDVPGTDSPTDDTFPGTDSDTGAPMDDREDWEEPSDAQPGQETDDVPSPAAPGTEAAPGADPAAPGAETAPGTDPAAPGTDPAAPGAEGDAGFGEGTEPMPGTEGEQDEWEEDTY